MRKNFLCLFFVLLPMLSFAQNWVFPIFYNADNKSVIIHDTTVIRRAGACLTIKQKDLDIDVLLIIQETKLSESESTSYLVARDCDGKESSLYVSKNIIYWNDGKKMLVFKNDLN